ncbi:MAG: hypothetical protein AAF845_06825 [Bacteroidota bacterium]
MLRNAFTPPCGFDLATTTVAGPHELTSIAYWGYRAVVHPDGSCFVHETYYDAREGLLGIAREPARPCGDTVQEVQDELDRMEEGLVEPPLRFLDYATDEPPPGASGDGAGGTPPEARTP